MDAKTGPLSGTLSSVGDLGGKPGPSGGESPPWSWFRAARPAGNVYGCGSGHRLLLPQDSSDVGLPSTPHLHWGCCKGPVTQSLWVDNSNGQMKSDSR